MVISNSRARIENVHLYTEKTERYRQNSLPGLKLVCNRADDKSCSQCDQVLKNGQYTVFSEKEIEITNTTVKDSYCQRLICLLTNQDKTDWTLVITESFIIDHPAQIATCKGISELYFRTNTLVKQYQQFDQGILKLACYSMPTFVIKSYFTIIEAFELPHQIKRIRPDCD